MIIDTERKSLYNLFTGFARAQRKPATSLANADIGPHNFKDHFDADILEYVTEDIRLSTLQRKLVRENNTLVSHALACQVRNPLYSYLGILLVQSCAH